MKKLALVICSLLVMATACKKEEDPGPSVMVSTPPPSGDNDTIGLGTFTGYDHGLSGSALLYRDTASAVKLRLYDFNMTAGPDVYVFLSKTSSYSAGNVLQLSRLTTGYTNSSFSLDVTHPNYSSEYQYVLVYCVQYSALFGFTQLTSSN